MKLTSLKPGDLVFNVEKTKMGNTTLKTISIYPVKIIEVHENHVIASWNGNAPKRFGENSVSKWKKKEPVTIVSGFGVRRLATKEEIAEIEKNKEVK